MTVDWRLQLKRALIVIDVQNEYVTGRLPIGYPSLDVSLANIGKAMDAARGAAIPVVVVQQVAPVTSPIFARGSEGAALHPAVARRPHEHLVEKALPSCFAGTDLADWLMARDVDTIAIVGYMTQMCDESTARDAAHRGLAVEFLSDATGTLALSNSEGSLTAEQLHQTVLVILHSRFAAVATTVEWVDAIATGRPLEGSSLYASTEIARGAIASG
jgi:nicotinamidase-related amidase